jgi:hypothetical protein
VLHLFGHLRKGAGDTKSGHGCGDVRGFSAGGAAGVWVPGFELAHATVHPEDDE